MAICTRCGAIWSDDDLIARKEHVCDPEDVPAKGKMVRKGKKPAEAENLK